MLSFNIASLFCALVGYSLAVHVQSSSALKDESIHASIMRRSDGLARHLVKILVEEKQERENLRKENRWMKKKLEDVLRELRERNSLLGDDKFQRKKLIEEVKSTKAELKYELKKLIKQQLENFNESLTSVKNNSDSNKQMSMQMDKYIKEIKTKGATLKKRLVSMKHRVQVLENSNKGQGAIYIRWGRNTCPPNNTDSVYAGQLGGSDYGRGKGGPTNYLCLPNDPDWRVYKSGMQPNNPIVGGEYQVGSYSDGELLDKKYENYEILCAVCQSRSRKAMIMIPGKSVCNKGWHLEYRGYLMSGHVKHSPSEYICVDANPDVITGSNKNNNGAILYTVEAGCTSMKCPPYVSGRELTCVVCTK